MKVGKREGQTETVTEKIGKEGKRKEGGGHRANLRWTSNNNSTQPLTTLYTTSNCTYSKHTHTHLYCSPGLIILPILRSCRQRMAGVGGTEIVIWYFFLLLLPWRYFVSWWFGHPLTWQFGEGVGSGMLFDIFANAFVYALLWYWLGLHCHWLDVRWNAQNVVVSVFGVSVCA